MDNNDAEIMELYVEQLVEIGYYKDDARILGQLLETSAGHFAEMFGMESEEYLKEKFAGYHSVESLKFSLNNREEIRTDIPRKSNLETMDVISLNTDFIPRGGIKEITKWARKILIEQGGRIQIKSSGKMIDFSRKGIESSVRKYDIDARSEIDHRQSYFALRKMVEIAEYWKSRIPSGKHIKDGWQDIYTSALNLNGTLYAVIIRFNEPNEYTKKMADKYGDQLPDNYYKEHRIDRIEIEIAPAHNGTSTIDNNGGSRPESDKSDSTGAISKISLGILRGCVKASLILKQG